MKTCSDKPGEGCEAGFTCVKSDKCYTLTCNSTLGALINTGCYGFCRPAVRTVLDATFSNSGRQIVLLLNGEARAASVPCSSLFDSSTIALLGAKAWCDIQGPKVTLTVPPTASVKPGDDLRLATSQSSLVDLLVGSVSFTGAVTVKTCAACEEPALVVNGPKVML